MVSIFSCVIWPFEFLLLRKFLPDVMKMNILGVCPIILAEGKDFSFVKFLGVLGTLKTDIVHTLYVHHSVVTCDRNF
jgi:hypothetical protein